MHSEKELAKNTVFQIGGKMLAVMLGVLTVTVLTRYLGLEGYGNLTIVLSYLSIFAAIVDFGLTLTTTQMISEHKADEEKLIGNLTTLRVLSAGIFLALAPIIAIYFPYDSAVKIGIAIGALSYLFGTTAQMFVGMFQKRLVISRAVLAELLNRLIVFLGAILAPTLHLDLVGILWLLTLGNLGQLITILIFAGRYIKIRLRINFDVWKDIIARSWPIGASIFFNLIYLRGDILFLSLYRSTEEVGLYGAAYKIVDVITVIPVMYMGLILPILVAAWAANRKAEFRQHLQKTFDFFVIIAVPFAVGSLALATPVMELIAGKDFAASGPILMILGPAASIVFIGSLFGHAIVGINKQKPMTVGYFVVAAITVIGYVITIPTYGMQAAAWWTFIAEGLIATLTFIVVVRVSDFRPKFSMFAKSALASIIMFVVLLLLPAWHVLILIAIGSIVYYLSLAAVGGPKVKTVIQLFLPEKPPIAVP